MLKKWYLVKCTKDKFKVDENLRKKLNYMNKIASDKGYKVKKN